MDNFCRKILDKVLGEDIIGSRVVKQVNFMKFGGGMTSLVIAAVPVLLILAIWLLLFIKDQRK